MPMHARLLALIVSVLLLSSYAEAASKKQAPGRPLASTKLEFRLDGPEVQRLEEVEATADFEALTSQAQSKIDQKTLEEFQEQLKGLISRGFEARTKRLRGQVFGSSRALTIYRKEKQELPAMNGEEAYTSLQFDFHYQQNFIEKGVAPKPNSILPVLELNGFIFVRCKARGNSCAVESVATRNVAISWEYPLSGRGANSSAGGAGQN